MSEYNQRKIKLSNTSLNYAKFKGGDKVILCFHGFGQDHKAFSELIENVKGHFTVYSFDIFFHGSSVWEQNDKVLLPSDWHKIMTLFFEKEAIDEFEVMGFSMGGKFAMITGQQFPDKTSRLHLLAPDGIKMHFSYRMSTLFLPFRKLFKTQIENPVIFNELVKISKALRLMDNYTLRFAETQMKTYEQRKLVYYSWVVFRHFMPDLKKLAGQINASKINATFYLGKYDKVIDEKAIAPLIKLLKHPDIRMIESGHSKLIDVVANGFNSD
jgi:pimeloyl-ACP methyl ester carboxylesterase